MTKGQGYASIGAILLAGVMFRGSLSSDPSRGSDRLRESTLASAEKSATGEGPWLASCRYWAAVRSAQPAAAKTAPQLNIKLTQTDTSFGATVNGSLEPAKTACERAGDGWGIPDKASKPKPEIHAIIVAVPDPIHSHLALEFDRSIDSLMQAAADYRFLGSSYWLPWRNPSSTVPVAQPTAPDQTAERTREEQPGLIILKYSPVGKEPYGETTSFYRVVYLFLSANLPRWASTAHSCATRLTTRRTFATRMTPRCRWRRPLGSPQISHIPLAFIGPRSSGSATSLRQGLLSAAFTKRPERIIGAGITSTEISQLELNAKSGPFQPPITYLSFGEDTKFEEDQLVKAFGNAGSDTQPTAILVEDNTLFGSANVLKDPDSKDSETLFASLKVERLHGQRFETIRQAKDETLAWLLWYNQTRMHSTLGYLSPIQFEQQWHRTTQAIAS